RGYGTDQMLLYYQNNAVHFNVDIVVLAFAFHHIPRNIRSFTFYAKPYYKLINGKLVLNGVPIPSAYILFDENHPGYKKNYFNRSVFLRTLLNIYKKYKFHKQFSENSHTWEITETIIKKFANVVRKNNTKFILVNIETEYEYLEPVLKNVASTLDIEYLNLGPKLRSAISSGMLLQIANDNHWSSHGHEFVAEQIYIYLCGEILKLICEE
ncbi:MAG: hypothetical protein ACR2PU_03590, partial [Gammaproteobacteria bacterium]